MLIMYTYSVHLLATMYRGTRKYMYLYVNDVNSQQITLDASRTALDL